MHIRVPVSTCTEQAGWELNPAGESGMQNPRFNVSSKRNSAEVVPVQRVLNLDKARKSFKMIFLLNLPGLSLLAGPVCDVPVGDLKISSPIRTKPSQACTHYRQIQPSMQAIIGLSSLIKASKAFPCFFLAYRLNPALPNWLLYFP
jgi:hypothetical protein